MSAQKKSKQLAIPAGNEPSSGDDFASKLQEDMAAAGDAMTEEEFHRAAVQRGIESVHDDVDKMINEDTGGPFNDEQKEELRRIMKSMTEEYIREGMAQIAEEDDMAVPRNASGGSGRSRRPPRRRLPRKQKLPRKI
ncbi:hypothetical protein LPJ59_004077 [Coemansia sp. RSA 2399]|nr:hypothetical protein LPJ59_004077 [Coemansia sp. RSA 2399]KAJ1901329.1 hypothetical protein LPJ81_003770 [Coemansia sp. IMI 209127]